MGVLKEETDKIMKRYIDGDYDNHDNYDFIMDMHNLRLSVSGHILKTFIPEIFQNRFQFVDTFHPMTCEKDHGFQVKLVFVDGKWRCPVVGCDWEQPEKEDFARMAWENYFKKTE